MDIKEKARGFLGQLCSKRLSDLFFDECVKTVISFKLVPGNSDQTGLAMDSYHENLIKQMIASDIAMHLLDSGVLQFETTPFDGNNVCLKASLHCIGEVNERGNKDV